MCEMEATMRVRSFFIMDENFLLYRQRAMELLARMKRAKQELGVLRVLFGQRDPQVHHARTGGTGRLVDLDGAGVAATRITPS